MLKKVVLQNKIQRNEERALDYFYGNLVKCEVKDLNLLKKIFLGIIKLNEKYSEKLNIEEYKIMSYKTIFRLALADSYDIEEIEKILENEDGTIFYTYFNSDYIGNYLFVYLF